MNSCSAGQQGFRGCITQGALEGTQRWAGCLLGGDCPWALEARCAAEKRACLFQRIGPTLTAAAAPVKAHSCTRTRSTSSRRGWPKPAVLPPRNDISLQPSCCLPGAPQPKLVITDRSEGEEGSRLQQKLVKIDSRFREQCGPSAGDVFCTRAEHEQYTQTGLVAMAPSPCGMPSKPVEDRVERIQRSIKPRV